MNRRHSRGALARAIAGSTQRVARVEQKTRKTTQSFALRLRRSPQRVARAPQEAKQKVLQFSHIASTRFTVYFSCACLYAFRRLLSLRMHLCFCLSTCPTHSSMQFIVYFPCACLYAFHCLLPSLHMHLCTCLSTCPMRASTHFTFYFPCACHLCISLCSCPTHFTVYFPTHASMHFTVYFPYAVELCRTQRLYWKNPSQCFREKYTNRNSTTNSFEKVCTAAANKVNISQ